MRTRLNYELNHSKECAAGVAHRHGQDVQIPVQGFYVSGLWAMVKLRA